MQRVIPSILATSAKEANKLIKKIEAHTELLHLDIADNTMTKTATMPMEEIPKLLATNKIHAHLMSDNPESWFPTLKKAKIRNVYIHAHTISNWSKSEKDAQKHSITIGVAIAPNEKIKKNEAIIKKAKYFLIVSVTPGKYGAKHRPQELKKIAQIKAINPQAHIVVDGGIKQSNYHKVLQLGANQVIVGSAIAQAKQPKKALQEFLKQTIYITRKIPDTGIKLLKKDYNLIIHQKDTKPSKAELFKNAAQADAILSLLTDTIDAKFITANPQLQIIANYAIGFNNIDIKTATQNKIPVTNTPGQFAGTVADHSFALLLAAAHRITEENDFTKANKYKGWSPMLFRGNEVHNKTIGIIGFGSIGQAMARRAQGFEMNILYYDLIRKDKKTEKQFSATFCKLNELLKKADYVSIHVPLLPETIHLISTKELSMMKKSAIIINTARGPVINEQALCKALIKKDIAAAGLDVFEQEPKHCAVLNKLPNAILTRHVASSTKEARDNMAEIAAQNIIAALSGAAIPNQINHWD